MATKRRSQLKHARRRARERYDLNLDPSEVACIVNKILRGESVVLARQSVRVSIHQVHYKDRWLIAVYDRKRRQIASFLPDDYYDSVDNTGVLA